MPEGPNLLICRLSIFSGMVAATVTLLYLAPVPDQSFKNCDRPCHDLDWPMICRFKLIIEKLPTSVICENCQDTSSSNCSFCSSPAKDLAQETFIVNNRFPAPPIHVCHNDIIIVDVTNKLQGQSLTLHWRGQTNLESPFMDGVPLITQCPISSYSTFQYKLRASSAGTHSYHAFSDLDRSNGLFGAVVVRKADRLEENIEYYQADDKEHVLMLSDSKENILINGVGPNGAPLSTFKVKEGTTYRFRVIYASGSGCSITFNIDNHLLKVIAVDGNSIKPVEASSVKLTKGETLDVVLTANQPPRSYFFKARSTCSSKNIFGAAVVSYEGTFLETNNKNSNLLGDLRKLDTGDCEAKSGTVCRDDIENVDEMDERLKTVDTRFYLGFDSKKGTIALPPYNYYRMNNISFVFPPSAMLTQPSDVPVDLMCNESYLPDRCGDNERCDCLHLEHIPLGSTTELVLVDQGGDEEDYIFHLHGHQFYIVGTKITEKPISKLEVEMLDTDFEFIKRNLKNPIRKHTVKVPRNGIVAIRFLANNPGFWMLRDENAKGWTRGLDVVFQVGDTGDLVDTPTYFPTCGNFIGPDFFLF